MSKINYPTSFDPIELDAGMAILYLGFDGASPTYCAGLLDNVVLSPTFNTIEVTQGTPVETYETKVISDSAELSFDLRQRNNIFHMAIAHGSGKSHTDVFKYGGNTKLLNMSAKVVHEDGTCHTQIKCWSAKVTQAPTWQFNKEDWNTFPVTMRLHAANTCWDTVTNTDDSGAGRLFWVEKYDAGTSHTDEGATSPKW